jgi:hypothetical protein
LDIQAVLKFNRSLVEGMAVMTTCLVSAVNSQFQMLVPLQAKVKVVGHTVRQAEECLVVVPV